MPLLLIYLLKLSVSLAAVYLFYHFVLRKLTFYNWNRWYLLGYSILSFFIALINIAPVLEKNQWSDNSIVEWVPVLQVNGAGLSSNTSPVALSVWQWIGLFVLAGILIMFIRLLIQFISFKRLLKKAAPLAINMLPGSGMKLYQVEENIIPFSFGNSIFINYRLHTKEELQEIVWHEFIHVKQKHSFDIICGEIICLLNWYNPFAWLIRRAIRQNLEFIADGKVLENGISRKEYQYLLLKVIGNNHFSIAPKFNFSSLKKRIAMMNKNKSAKAQVVKFLFLLPVAVVMLLAFRSKYENMQVQPSHDTKSVRDTVPPPPVPPMAPAAMKLPENVEKINSNNGNVTVWLKNGNKEKYNLNDVQQKMEFDNKYGTLPEPPPPPELPKGVRDMSRNGQNIVTVTMENGKTEKFDFKKESEKNQFENKYGKMPEPPATPVAPRILMGDESISRVSKEFEITDKKAWIKLMDETVENYDLTNAKEKAAFENKYGKIYNLNLNTNVNTLVSPRITTNINSSLGTNVNSNVNADVNTNVNTTIRAKVAPVSPDPFVTTIITASSVSEGNNPVAVITPVAIRTTGVRGTTPRPAAIAGRGMTGVIDDYGYVVTGKEDIIISITRNTTRPELDKFISQMKEKGVELNFDEIEYEKGLLVKLTGTMKSGDSRSNFVAVDFRTLTLAMIKKGDKTWFKVGTTDKNEVI